MDRPIEPYENVPMAPGLVACDREATQSIG